MQLRIVAFASQVGTNLTDQGQDGSVLGILAGRPRLECLVAEAMMGEEIPFEVGAGRGADEVRSFGPIGAGETRASCLVAESLGDDVCIRGFVRRLRVRHPIRSSMPRPTSFLERLTSEGKATMVMLDAL